jgi:hypothetical protein
MFIISIIWLLLTPGATARQPESDDAAWARFVRTLKAQVEEMANNPEEMKEYILSRDDVWTDHYKNGNTLLHYAANRGYLDVVKLLLEKGAGVNSRNDDGRTPLHEAMSYRHYDVARFLIEKGANTALRDRQGETALIAVVYMADKKMAVELVNFFIRNGFDVKKSADVNLLNQSIGRGHRDVALILLNKDAAFDDASLYAAARKGDGDVFGILLSKGANPRQKGILRAACGSGNVDIVKTLLKKGNDFALYNGRVEVAACLNDLLYKSEGQRANLRERCALEPDPGDCKAAFHRGFYNQKTKRCGTFIYGGCGGKAPFDSEEACRMVCEEHR